MTLLAMSCDITSHGGQPQTSPGCLLSPTRSAGRSTPPTDWIRHHRCRRDSAAWVRHGGARSPCPYHWRLPFSWPTEFVAEEAALSGAGRMAWKLSPSRCRMPLGDRYGELILFCATQDLIFQRRSPSCRSASPCAGGSFVRSFVGLTPLSQHGIENALREALDILSGEQRSACLVQ